MEEFQHYSISINNGIISNSQVGTPTRLASTIQSLTTPFLDEPNKWKMACTRMALATEDLPKFISTCEMGQPDANRTIFYVALEYKGTYIYENVAWFPQIQGIPKPTDVSQYQDSDNRYYWCYTYQWFMRLVNVAYSFAFDSLKAIYPELSATRAPWLEYDESTQTFTFFGDMTYYEDASDDLIGVYMSSTLEYLFPNFPFIVDNTKQALYKISFYSKPSGTNIISIDDVDVVEVKQEYPTLSAWCPVQRIVLMLTKPVATQESGIPTPSWGSASTTNNAPISSLSMLTDIQVVCNIGYDGANQGYIYYEPENIRWVNILQTSPIMEFNVKLMWADNYDGLHDVSLRESRPANIKFEFRKMIE